MIGRFTFSRYVLASLLVLAGCATPHGEADERLRLIDAAKKSGNPRFALVIAKRYVEENSGDLHAQVTFASLLAEQGLCERAIPELHRSAKLGMEGNNGHDATVIRGYLRCREFQKALDLALRHLERNPEKVDILNMSGVALDGLSRHDQAQAAYRQALAIQPNRKAAYNLALSLLLSGKPRESLAILSSLRSGEFEGNTVGGAATYGDITKKSIVILEALGLAKDGRMDEARVALGSVVPEEEANMLLSRLK